MFDEASQRVANFYQNAFVTVQKLIAPEAIGNFKANFFRILFIFFNSREILWRNLI